MSQNKMVLEKEIIKKIKLGYLLYVPEDYSKETERMVQALEKINGNIKCTIYPETTHNCWTQAYNQPELYDWLLAQKKIR